MRRSTNGASTLRNPPDGRLPHDGLDAVRVAATIAILGGASTPVDLLGRRR
jgi:hypothetical protein